MGHSKRSLGNPIACWVLGIDGRQKGVILHDASTTRDQGVSLDLLRRSLIASTLSCDVWLNSDVRAKAVYLRNLKQLQPFLAADMPNDDELQATLVAHLRQLKEATVDGLQAEFADFHPTELFTALAKLQHRGEIAAELSDSALNGRTVVRIA